VPGNFELLCAIYDVDQPAEMYYVWQMYLFDVLGKFMIESSRPRVFVVET